MLALFKYGSKKCIKFNTSRLSQVKLSTPGPSIPNNARITISSDVRTTTGGDTRITI